MRVVVSGGGTGGHIYPALAVAEKLRVLEPGVEVLYVGGTSGMEAKVVPEAGVPFQAVTARKLRKILHPSTVSVGLSLVKGYVEARGHLRRFGAQAVLGTGGYVAAAATLAGAHLGLPTLILAPDFVPGRTNLMLARRARKICVAFEETRTYFPQGKTVVTGMPLRAGITAPSETTHEDARTRLGLNPDSFTLLVVGGSQGAQAVNKVVSSSASRLMNANVQILHQVGARNYDVFVRDASDAFLSLYGLVVNCREDDACVFSPAERAARSKYTVRPFLNAEQMSLALRAADLILCRGGISTLSEVMVNGLPSIIVPLPTAYADHQTANARPLDAAGAAILCPQAQLENRLTALVEELSGDPARRIGMSEAARRLARPNAADDVARLLLDAAEKR